MLKIELRKSEIKHLIGALRFVTSTIEQGGAIEDIEIKNVKKNNKLEEVLGEYLKK